MVKLDEFYDLLEKLDQVVTDRVNDVVHAVTLVAPARPTIVEVNDVNSILCVPTPADYIHYAHRISWTDLAAMESAGFHL